MKVDIRGKYIPIRTIKSQDEWEKVIEAFVALGAGEWEGREGKAEMDYAYEWSSWSYIGVDENVEVVHYDLGGSYSGEGYNAIEITKEYLFSLVEGGGVTECADKTGVMVPDGWKLVPVEITDAMVDASGCEGQYRLSAHEQAQSLWSAMLEAAPSHNQQSAEVWQPIETAPREGRGLIYFGRSGHVEDASFLTTDDGVWAYVLFDGEQINDSPTHWMPLPTPPEP